MTVDIVWDQDPKRRGAFAEVEGFVAHAYFRSPGDGWMCQWCHPAAIVGSDEAMGPHPPELPLCPKCARLSGIADRLVRES